MKKPFVLLSILIAVFAVLPSKTIYATVDEISLLVNEVNSDYLLDNLVYLTSFSSRSSYEVQDTDHEVLPK